MKKIIAATVTLLFLASPALHAWPTQQECEKNKKKPACVCKKTKFKTPSGGWASTWSIECPAPKRK